ncbi:cationic amino acid transporter 3 isoform X3 [Hylaeus volcanicus]|uniref:cationic amino acid transporter 3 isoform X3 n=2 Tax=Hylaeus volcanicus TaxID=313075 RepID=UPI0023B7859E|nr:cationic amino acid transporter 3 isoform X3 [Hylaeus volcanicus]
MKLRRLCLLFIVACYLSLSHALECYVCTNQEGNREKCLKSTKTCEQGQDACFTEIKWGSTPYWSQGAKKQFYVSKRCSTRKECERIRQANMNDCTYIWYQDWKCSQCCQGDKCNYYVIVHNMKIRVLRGLHKAFTRKKEMVLAEDTKLARCLSTLDLTALGIGSTLGVGVYVLAGSVSKTTAGPAVIISFAIAAIASMFAGLCYAEFGARVPRAGSAYVYSYVTMGEFTAFVIGWTLILEYVIGSASVVRGLSTYVDALLNNTMRNAFESAAPIDVSYLSTYPDFFAFGVTLIFSAALAFGAKESSVANNVFTLVNLMVVLFVIIAGSLKADVTNWKTKPTCTETNCDYGTGGFAPYGIGGIITGAATCFYGFIGFDCVATTGEEAKDPQRSIPIAIVASLTVVFLAYFGVSTVLTMVLPYYEQNSDAPFPYLFDKIGWSWAKWVVSIGAICGLCASLLGAMFPLPRVLYAMASDGLIFEWMGKISSRFHTPLMGTFSAGILTGVLATIFELTQLVNMMSIGTLLAYSIVAACVLVLRYEESEAYEKKDDRDPRTLRFIGNQLINANKLKHSTKLTSQIVTYLVGCYLILCICVGVILSMFSGEVTKGETAVVVPLAVLILALLASLTFIYLQPTSGKKLAFSVPLVPFLPALSILVNIYLMMMLDRMTWVRFLIWMAIGLGIYFCYGIWHSKMRRRESIKPNDNGVNKETKSNSNFPRLT